MTVLSATVLLLLVMLLATVAIQMLLMGLKTYWTQP